MALRIRCLMECGLITATLLGLCGCAGMNRPYPAKRHFGLEAGPQAKAGAAAGEHTLRIHEFRVAPPYHGLQFVYQIGACEFESDYYHEFITTPAALITTETIMWLRHSGLFASVLQGGSAVNEDYVLEGTVTTLCGDYRDKSAPKALLEVQLFLLAESGTETGIVLERSYRRETAVKVDDPGDLVRGWNEALHAILTEFERDLREKAAAGATAESTEWTPE